MAVPYTSVIRPLVAHLSSQFGISGGAPAEAMLISTGLQESDFRVRDQITSGPNVIGPATGFWQFEKAGGVRGVMRHPASRDIARQLASDADVAFAEDAIWRSFVEAAQDELACGFARLLLLTDPQPLPVAVPASEDAAWLCYLRNWRPGAPHRDQWTAHWRTACQTVTATTALGLASSSVTVRSHRQHDGADGLDVAAWAGLAARVAAIEERVAQL